MSEIRGKDQYGDVNLGVNAIFDPPLQSPFNPNTNASGAGSEYQGVFLNQGSPNWSPPYYSVRVQQTQAFTVNGQTRDGYFLNWSTNGNADLAQIGNSTPGYDEKAVIFRAGTERIVTANYKGHLLSSVPSALSSSAQRKIARLNFFGLGQDMRMVYESSGAVYATSTTDNGLNWCPEYNPHGLPPAGTTYRNPTIEPALDNSQEWIV